MTRLVLFVLACLAATSCGYRAGLAPGVPLTVDDPDGAGRRAARSIGMQIFDNETLMPNMERDFHRALTVSARRHTDLVVQSPGIADLVVRGSIKDFHRRRGSRTTGNRLVETQEFVTVRGQLVDRTSGRVLGQATTTTQVGSAIDVSGRLPVQRQRAIENASDRLLLLLLGGLEYGVTRPGEELVPHSTPREGSPGAEDRSSAPSGAGPDGAPSGAPDGAAATEGTSTDEGTD